MLDSSITTTSILILEWDPREDSYLINNLDLTIIVTMVISVIDTILIKKSITEYQMSQE